jgi:uncharacterized protein
MFRRLTDWLACCLLLAVFWLAFAQPAWAQTRRALVIGVDDYRHVAKLQKAVGDARAMKAALEKLGFEVDLLTDPDRAAFNAGISAFTAKLKDGDVALVHYSGHGVALDGENYLLPVDAPRPDKVDKEGLKLETFALMALLERVRSTGSNVQIAIVDACRDNPYALGGTRSIGRSGGLAEPQRKPARGQGGFFILFSAGFGQTAADRLDDSDREPTSVYTRMLLRKMTVEGKAITDLAREVREDVEALAATVRHEQRPAYYDELSGPAFYFNPPRAGAKDPAALRDLELSFWNSIQDSSSPALFREYLDRFGGTATFASIARDRLKSLEARQPQVVTAPAQPSQTSQPQPQNVALNFQPSFDCRTDTQPVERTICANAALASRDRILSETYYRIADRLPQSERAALRDKQREWIRQRNACATDAACIARAYDSRLAQLQGAAQPSEVAALPQTQTRAATANVAPSFACAGQLSNVERMICSDPALAERDNRLNEVYKQARSRPGVTESQRTWIRQRNACMDAACVARAYDARIGELSRR